MADITVFIVTFSIYYDIKMSYKPAYFCHPDCLRRMLGYIKRQTEQGQFGSCGCCRHDVATLERGAIWCRLGEKKVPFGAIFGAVDFLLDKC